MLQISYKQPSKIGATFTPKKIYIGTFDPTPPPPQYSPEAQAMIDTYLALGDGLAGTELAAMVGFVDNEVAIGNHILKDSEAIFGLSGNNALVDYIRGTAMVNNGATFSSDGAIFNGIDQYIDSNYNPLIDGVNYRLNDANVGFYAYDAKQSQGSRIYSANDGVSALELRVASGALRGKSNSSIDTAVAGTPPLSNGLFTVLRDAIALSSVYKDGVLLGNMSHSSEAIPNQNIFLACFNDNGTPSQFKEGTFSSFLAGAAIGFNQLEYYNNLTELLANK